MVMKATAINICPYETCTGIGLNLLPLTLLLGTRLSADGNSRRRARISEGEVLTISSIIQAGEI